MTMLMVVVKMMHRGFGEEQISGRLCLTLLLEPETLFMTPVVELQKVHMFMYVFCVICIYI